MNSAGESSFYTINSFIKEPPKAQQLVIAQANGPQKNDTNTHVGVDINSGERQY